MREPTTKAEKLLRTIYDELSGNANYVEKRMIEDFFDCPELPPFPPEGHCVDCGSTDFLIQEDGYGRTTRAEYDPDENRLNAFTNGWSDMTEDGEREWIECRGCPAKYAMTTGEVYYS